MQNVLLNREQVMSILPHREPMLLVDEVLSLEPLASVETRFFVRPDWDVLRGHFPGDPVLPGVLAVECMAQASDVMIMTAERYAGKTPLFAGINSARFSRKIRPGRKVTAKAVVNRIDEERDMITCGARLFVEEELAASAEIVVAMR